MPHETGVGLRDPHGLKISGLSSELDAARWWL